MTSLSCSECGVLEDPDDPQDLQSFWKCDMCGEMYCNACSGVTATEITCLQMKKRTLIYYCTGCKQNVMNIPELAKTVKSLQVKDNKGQQEKQSASTQTTLEAIAASLADMKKVQATTNSKLDDLSVLKEEFIEVEKYVKSLSKQEDYKQLKRELTEQIQKLPNAASYEEFKSSVTEQIQDLPTAANYAQLRDTVVELKCRVEKGETGANQREQRSNASGLRESDEEIAAWRMKADLNRINELLHTVEASANSIRAIHLGKKRAGSRKWSKILFFLIIIAIAFLFLGRPPPKS